MVKLAAIDIGSNAIRLQVSSVLHTNGEASFKKVEYLRFPLRLGENVFKSGQISLESQHKLLQVLEAFKLLIACYGVEQYMVCATAAFREANNGKAVVEKVQKTLNMAIHLVSGQEEAALIYKAISPFLEEGTHYLHVDVGGGSTEVSFYTGKDKVAVYSFNLGSVRVLERRDQASEWEALQKWIARQRQHCTGTLRGLATGGNIRKLAQMARKGGKKLLTCRKLLAMQDHIASYTLEERINKLRMNPDRADVILPATRIYSTAMRAGNVQEIIVPDVSLRDGIIQSVYEQYYGSDTFSTGSAVDHTSLRCAR